MEEKLNRHYRRARLAVAKSGKTQKTLTQVTSLALRILESEIMVKEWMANKQILGGNTPLELVMMGGGKFVADYLHKMIKDFALSPVETRRTVMMQTKKEDVEEPRLLDFPTGEVSVTTAHDIGTVTV